MSNIIHMPAIKDSITSTSIAEKRLAYYYRQLNSQGRDILMVVAYGLGFNPDCRKLPEEKNTPTTTGDNAPRPVNQTATSPDEYRRLIMMLLERMDGRALEDVYRYVNRAFCRS